MNALQESDRLELLRWCSRESGIKQASSLSLKLMAEKTAGFSLPDIQSVLRQERRNSKKRINDGIFSPAIMSEMSNLYYFIIKNTTFQTSGQSVSEAIAYLIGIWGLYCQGRF